MQKLDKNGKLHLAYLDGIRGLAALYVVVYHCVSYTFLGFETIPSSIQTMTAWTSYGHFAVVVFIVLSGYCLTLPIILSPNNWFKGGVKHYLKRRALRILPPYFAAIILSLLVIFFIPSYQEIDSLQVSWKHWLPAFDWGVLISHLFLVHNLNEHWIYKINDPAWSVATEWQLYFIMPLLIILWKKFGVLIMLVISLTPGIVVQLLLPQFSKACPWFLGCFAIGVAGAIVSFSKLELSLETGKPFFKNANIISLLLFSTFFFLVYSYIPGRYYVIADTLTAFLTTISIVLIFNCIYVWKSFIFPLLSILESKPLVFMGTISYSLYLIHSPTLNTIQLITSYFHMDVLSSLVVILGFGLPILLIAAFVFYRLVELPAIRFRSR